MSASGMQMSGNTGHHAVVAEGEAGDGAPVVGTEGSETPPDESASACSRPDTPPARRWEP